MAIYRGLVLFLSVLLWDYATGFNEHHGNVYENYTLYSLVPHNMKQVKDLAYLANLRGDLELLKGSRGVNDSHDILVPPQNIEILEAYAQSQNLSFTVKRKNYGRSLARSFEAQIERQPRRRQMSSFRLFDFNSYDMIVNYVTGLERHYPRLVKVEDIGKTFEDRPMKLVKISTNPDAGNPIIFIDAGIHAREWVAPSMALYIMSRLTRTEAQQNELNGVDWYIVPIVNPDGYEFTRSSLNNRLWRKTRSRHGTCFGVDGNRNYDFHWGVSGVSFDPCDKETFAGPSAFSEVETRNIRNAMQKYRNNIKLYVSLHSYGQYLVYPWGFTEDYRPKTWRALDQLARQVSAAVVRAGGLGFKIMSAGEWYPAAGGSDDYAFGALGIPYSYTMELTKNHDFIFPSGLLKSTLPQLYAGFQVFAKHIKNEFSKNKGHVRQKK